MSCLPLRVALVDDHPVVALGLRNVSADLQLVADFSCVEDLVVSGVPDVDAVLLDLQLRRAGGPQVRIGTEAVRYLLDAGVGTVVVFTSVIEDMVIAGCLSAGALGAVSKQSPVATLLDVVRMAASGRLWVDPAIAGGLLCYAEQRHAGALSPQQANALRFRGQGLKQQAIAERIGVSDPEIVQRYLRTAVSKISGRGAEPEDRHPGAVFDDLAVRTGLASGLVRWRDVVRRRSR